MSWKKAMIVEKAIAKRLEAGTIGKGSIFRDNKSHCMIGVGLEALGITSKKCRVKQEKQYPDHPRDVLNTFGVPEAMELLGYKLSDMCIFHKRLWEVIVHNDGMGQNTPQNQTLAAELFVSAIKEFVPDDE